MVKIMPQNTCLILSRECDEFEAKLKKYDLPNLGIIIGRDEPTIQAALPTVNIIFGESPAIKKHIAQATNIAWVQSSFAGVDALIGDGLPQHYVLTNVKETYGKPMAEYVFAYLLGLKRQVWKNRDWQFEQRWNQFSYPVIEGESIGIVGTGSIGKQIARVAQAFGMKTRGMNTQGSAVEYFDQAYATTDQEAFFSGLDYIISVLPNTPQTKHFFDQSVFTLMEPSAWFINVGRGSNVCEADLVQALESEQIAGAVLDVFENEPLSADSPLWRFENVYITPHVSGYVQTDTAFEIFASNYQKFCAGEPLDYQIDFQKGY